MSLLNQHWQSFSGEPITGRTPPQTRIMNDVPMNALQAAGVAHAYKLFTDAVSVTSSKFLTRDRTLLDGTRVRLASNQGIDVVMVWPVGGMAGQVIDRWLCGVPASSTWMDGYSSAEAGGFSNILNGFEFWPKYETTQPPTTLKIEKELARGHVEWSSPLFVVDKRKVQLSYRGPGSRYSPSPGFNEDGVCKHTDSKELLTDSNLLPRKNALWRFLPSTFDDFGRDEQRTDSPWIWINNRPVSVYQAITWPYKIIAAAFHRPDPADKGDVILRVCTGHNPVGGFTGVDTTDFRIHVVDIKPVGFESDPAPLSAYLKATSFFAVATHVAANSRFNKSVAGLPTGTWAPMQRPHFDDNGARLALVVLERYTATTTSSFSGTTTSQSTRCRGVAFSLPSWEEAGAISADSESITNSSTSVSAFVSTHNYTVATTQYSVTRNKYFYGVDFHNNNLVAMIVEDSTISESEFNSSPTSETDGSTTSRTIKLVHSVHGVIGERTLNSTTTSNLQWSGGPALGAFTGFTKAEQRSEIHDHRLSVAADLSRDICAFAFAQGVVGGSSSTTASGVPNGAVSTSSTVAGTDNIRLSYKCVIDGVEVGVVNGGYISSSPPGQTAGSTSSGNTAWDTSYYTFVIRSEPPNNQAQSSTSSVAAALFATSGIASPRSKAIYTAVNRDASAAYIAVAHYNDALSVLVRKKKDKTFEIVSLPAYAPGTMSVLSTPFFLEVIKT